MEALFDWVVPLSTVVVRVDFLSGFFNNEIASDSSELLNRIRSFNLRLFLSFYDHGVLYLGLVILGSLLLLFIFELKLNLHPLLADALLLNQLFFFLLPDYLLLPPFLLLHLLLQNVLQLILLFSLPHFLHLCHVPNTQSCVHWLVVTRIMFCHLNLRYLHWRWRLVFYLLMLLRSAEPWLFELVKLDLRWWGEVLWLLIKLLHIHLRHLVIFAWHLTKLMRHTWHILWLLVRVNILRHWVIALWNELLLVIRSRRLILLLRYSLIVIVVHLFSGLPVDDHVAVRVFHRSPGPASSEGIIIHILF